MPAVSVIVPVYNVEKYLEKCLDSVISQTFQDFEIVIVNDGSTDSSNKIIQNYAEKYPDKIRAFTKQNGGLSSSRNFALERIEGEYLVFLDSDDYLDKNYLKILYSTAKKDNYDIVCSGQNKVGNSGEILKIIKYPVDKNPDTILRKLNIAGKMYRRMYVEKHNMRFAVGKTYEDNPFNLVMLFVTKKMKIISYEGYNQLVRTDSITANKIYEEKLPFEEIEKSIAYVVKNKGLVSDFSVFEFTILSFFTYFIFQANKKHAYLDINDRKSDKKVIFKLCSFSVEMLEKYFPKYWTNKNIGVFKNTELQFVQRLGVWGFVKLCKYHRLKDFAALYYMR